jgi:1-pyrroline-5-carboxylate dehydrogenase
MSFSERAAIFLKAADLLSGPYRYKMMAATILGQGKNAWQAEIDAAAELADFWRFNCTFAEQIYAEQPTKNSSGTWNRVEYRPLEGFVVAISPFNFTAIGGNLPSAPALMGNVVLWKPSSSAILSNYLIHEILTEAGLPAGVIQFIPGPSGATANALLNHSDLAGLHFTGSTEVFKKIWKQVGNNIDIYKSYPRLVGETGGKNFHFIHESADLPNAVHNTIRSAFEYQGQKCSACSRIYVPDRMWPEFKKMLTEEMKEIKQGGPEDFTAFSGPVVNRSAFDKIRGYIEYAKSAKDAEIIIGGGCDDSKGYFIQPTVIQTTNSDFRTMKEEIFGPVLTVFVYPSAEYEEYVLEAC